MKKRNDEIKIKIIFASFFIIIISMISIIIYKTYAFYKVEENYDVIKAKIGDFRGTTVNYTYYIDDNIVDDIPTKGQYKYIASTCDNATLTWNEETWLPEINSAQEYRVNCNIVFTEIYDLYEKIKSQSIGLDTVVGLNYDEISSDTNGKGVYETKDTDSGKSVYFYRGDIDNNNIIFGGFCWKIVRTTETGGIKLIYNGKPVVNKCSIELGADTHIGKSQFNTANGDNAYVGYMYGTSGSTNYDATHENKNESVIKQKIDLWYENNLNNYENYIEDAVYCNDRSTIKYDSNKILNFSSYGNLGYGTNNTLYSASARGWANSINTMPTLKCKLINDRFTVNGENGNGSLKYPIATITIDEIIYAGLTGGYSIKSTNSINTNFYLYNNVTYWTMTPIASRSDYTGIARLRLDGYTDYNATNMYYAIRPVISLKNGSKVTGLGTIDNPYELIY